MTKDIFFEILWKNVSLIEGKNINPCSAGEQSTKVRVGGIFIDIGETIDEKLFYKWLNDWIESNGFSHNNWTIIRRREGSQ